MAQPVPSPASATGTLTTGQRILMARKEKGWTQEQLANAAGIAQAEVSRYENGRSDPIAGTVDKIMHALGGSPILDTLDGQLGIIGRTNGALRALDVMGEAPPIEWLVEGFAARGAVTMIAGAPGSGKSLLTQALASIACTAMIPVRVSCDEHGCPRPSAKHRHQDVRAVDFAGMTVQPARVMVIDAENGEHLIQRRLRGMNLPAEAAEYVTWLEADGFDLEADREQLRAALAGKQTDLLILDTWTSLWGGSEQSTDGVKRCLNGLRELAREFNCAIVLIHHTTKGADGYRGSSAIGGTIEAVFIFTRNEDGRPEERLLSCEKMRLDAEPKTRKLLITTTGTYAAEEV